MAITIRSAMQEDIPAIAAIEESAPSSWSEAQLTTEFTRSDSIVLVAGDHQSNTSITVIGWSCLRYVVPEAELLKITVLPDHRHSGYGLSLLEGLFKRIVHLGCRVLFLEVRSKNLAARNLYLRSGFSKKGIRKKYYQDPEDDAVLYRKQLAP